MSCKKFKYIQDLYWICRYRQCFAPQCNGRSSSMGARFCKQPKVQSCLSPASLTHTSKSMNTADIIECIHVMLTVSIVEISGLTLHWNKYRGGHYQWRIYIDRCPAHAPPPPKGPDFFILTYKIFEM